MKKILLILAAFILVFECYGEKKTIMSDGTLVCKVQNGIIQTPVPQRAKGQKDMLKFACAPIPIVRVGFVGLGMRGIEAVERFTFLNGVEIKALCDLHPDRVEKCQKILEKKGLPKAADYSGAEEAWKKMCDREDIDLIYICTDWKHHTPIALYAMEHNKHVACEVPTASTLKEIWDLVNTSEKRRKHCIQLENCVYDFFELTTLNMAQHGLLGEVIHTEGSYQHNLADFWDYYESDWRMKFNKAYKGDIYATHGMGPACQPLNIHRGDKLNLLVAMDTKAFKLPEYLKEKRGETINDFKNGDVTMTLMKTEKGKTIHIQHCVADPRPYSRMYQITGTKGFANKYPVEGYSFEEVEKIGNEIVPDHQNLSSHSYVPEKMKEAIMERYKHPILKEIEAKAKEVGGHGGMDFIMDYRLIYCLQKGLPLDMDVYDLAEWCCVGPLSRLSIENNSMPVAIPDFTRGNWNRLNGLTFEY